MMTRRNDFVDCDRQIAVDCGLRNRANANYAANNYRPRTRGEPAFNRPYDCVLIMEGYTRCKRVHTHSSARARTYTQRHAERGSVDCSLPAAQHGCIFFSQRVRSINSAILRAPLDLTSRFSIVRCARDARSRRRASRIYV